MTMIQYKPNLNGPFHPVVLTPARSGQLSREVHCGSSMKRPVSNNNRTESAFRATEVPLSEGGGWDGGGGKL